MRSALCRQAGRDEGMSTSVEQRDDADSCRRWLGAIRIEHRPSLQEDTCHLQESVRDATEGAAYEWLSGRIMRIDLESGRILGSMESPGHWITVSPLGDIFAASLTGNVIRWTPGWPEKH